MPRAKKSVLLTTMIALLACFTCSLGAASVTVSAPAPTSQEAALDAVLQNGLDQGLPGLALRVERGDQVIYDRATGFSSIESETPTETSDRFRAAGVTKTFTAVLILQLVDDGVLRLDDTVSQWLDDPVVARIPNVDWITLRQLMNHTSGVYDYFDEDSPFWQDAYFGPDADWTRVWSPLELLAYAGGARHAPYFAPGEGSHYSNSAYVLLGLIVEAASGETYADQLQAGILDRLGMEDTFYGATEQVTGGTVSQYHVIDGQLVNVDATHLSALDAAGGMVSTTRDLARFIDGVLGGELLQPATLAEMLTFVPSQYPGADWGLGLLHPHSAGGAFIGHEGDGPGSSARMFRDDERDLTIVLLVNAGGADEVITELYGQIIEALITV
jgi:D-alanyl-D-alanine carboxypeptidase